MTTRVTASWERNAIRLVVFRDERVLHWDTFPLANLPPEAGPEEAGRQVRRLWESKGLKVTDAVAGFSDRSLLARQFTMPRVARRLQAEAVAKEVEDRTPFSSQEVEVCWQAFPNGTDQHVLAYCYPADAMESCLRLLKAAGLRKISVFPRSLALAHATAQPDAIFLGLEREYTEITVVQRGLPRAHYQSPLNMADGDRREGLAALSAEIERVLRAFASSIDPGHEDLPIIPTGSLADRTLVADLARTSTREVRHFTTPVLCPSNFDVCEYAVNLGLVLVARPRTLLPRVNILPARYRPAPFPWKRAALAGVLLAMLAAAPLVERQVSEKAAGAAALNARNERLQDRLRQQRLLVQEGVALQQEAAQVQAYTAQLDGQLELLRSQRTSAMQRLWAITNDALPAGMALTSVGQRTGGFNVRAIAPAYGDGTRYVDQLQATRLFEKVELLEAQVGKDGILISVGVLFNKSPPAAQP